MTTALILLQFVTLLAVIYLLLRKSAPAAQDPRLTELPDKLNRLIAEEARRTRDDSSNSATELRKEVVSNIATLGDTLKHDLQNFRDDNTASATALRALNPAAWASEAPSAAVCSAARLTSEICAASNRTPPTGTKPTSNG